MNTLEIIFCIMYTLVAIVVAIDYNVYPAISMVMMMILFIMEQ